MNIRMLQGMRYPSEAVIRMFYKEGLDKVDSGKILELGCGTANHLMHFAEYGWDVTGVDFDADSLAKAKYNLELNGKYGQLYLHDLCNPLPQFTEQFDVLLAPSSLYYVPREAAISRLKEANQYIKIGGLIFLHMRLPDDHRYARGKSAGASAWTLDCEYTGEAGLLNVFFTEYELIVLMNEIFSISVDNLTILKLSYENLQGSMIIRNSDIIIWGRKGE
jgi:SAM-dependent methyltransferase